MIIYSAGQWLREGVEQGQTHQTLLVYAREHARLFPRATFWREAQRVLQTFQW